MPPPAAPFTLTSHLLPARAWHAHSLDKLPAKQTAFCAHYQLTVLQCLAEDPALV